MPKEYNETPQSWGGWRFIQPQLAKLAASWEIVLPPEVMNERTLKSIVFMAAREPAKLSPQGIADFWKIYSAQPDWILAVMQVMRAKTVNPRSPREAITALLYADWMDTSTPGEVVDAAKAEFPSVIFPRDYDCASNVQNARSTIRKAQDPSGKYRRTIRALKKSRKI